jgi:hypothetical protein
VKSGGRYKHFGTVEYKISVEIFSKLYTLKVCIYSQKYNGLAHQQVCGLQEDAQFHGVTFAALSFRVFSKQSQYVHGLTHLMDGFVQGFHWKTKEPQLNCKHLPLQTTEMKKSNNFVSFISLLSFRNLWTYSLWHNTPQFNCPEKQVWESLTWPSFIIWTLNFGSINIYDYPFQ